MLCCVCSFCMMYVFYWFIILCCMLYDISCMLYDLGCFCGGGSVVSFRCPKRLANRKSATFPSATRGIDCRFPKKKTVGKAVTVDESNSRNLMVQLLMVDGVSLLLIFRALIAFLKSHVHQQRTLDRTTKGCKLIHGGSVRSPKWIQNQNGQIKEEAII